MIPLSATTIDVLRVAPADEYAEPYSGDDTARRTLAHQGVRAVIQRSSGRSTGTESTRGGEQAVWDLELMCDLIELRYTDTVRDNATGTVYRVVWVVTYPNDHVEAGLRVILGEV